MNARPSFHLTLFGTPGITDRHGAAVSDGVPQRHRLALLALLSLPQRGGWSRDKLLGHLWPERDSEHGRQLLNQAVYKLRKVLGEAAIVSSADVLTLNDSVVRVDVREFEAALRRSDASAATQWYVGPLLDGFFLNDSAEFEQWVARERERLASQYAGALEALAAAAETAGDVTTAAGWWKARAMHDPYDSRVALRLMQALDAAGNRAGALQHARLHEQLLRDEFGAEPPGELLVFAKGLRTESRAAEQRTAAALRPTAARPAARMAAAEAADATGFVHAPHGVPTALPRRSRLRAAGVWTLVLAAVAAISFAAGRTLLAPAAGSGDGGSIAVLPLVNHSLDPAAALLAQGMTEGIVAVLAKQPGLRVISPTSVSLLRNGSQDVRSIADTLKVATVLEGGLQKVGERLRVQVRLVDARDGTTRWAEIYDERAVADVFAVQDEIAQAVAWQLGVRLGPRSGAARRPPTNSVAAYELFLRGSDRVLLRNDSTVRDGIRYMRRAIALDSTYAAAWAGLGRLLARAAPPERPDMPTEERIELAERTVRKALQLDDSLAEAHATLGVIRNMRRDPAGAERHLKLAIQLEPARAMFHEWLVLLYSRTGQPAEALAHAEHALRLDPISPYATAEMARALLLNDRCDEALFHLGRLADLQPPLLRAGEITAQCYIRLGRHDDAIALLRSRYQLVTSSPQPPHSRAIPVLVAHLAFALGRAGQLAEARTLRDVLIRDWSPEFAYGIAMAAAGAGDYDDAFAWLERTLQDDISLENTGSAFYHLITLPVMQEFRRDPRFEALREPLRIQKM